MNFCEKCNILTEECVCRQCGTHTREPQDIDLCFFAQLGYLANSMLSDALTNNDIDFVSVPIHEGYSQLNTPSGYRFYVKYADYNDVFEIYDMIFNEDKSQCQDSDDDPSNVIDRIVKVIVDRPYGSVHPEHPDLKYKLNYGYVEGVTGGDGDWQDAYIMDFKMPLVEYTGYVVAVIRRKNDAETKWVVGTGRKYTKEEIAAAVDFQEKFFNIEIIM